MRPLKAGFTLVELIVVMMIIGVLASLLLVNFQGARQRSRDSVRKSDLQQIRNALQIYYTDFQVFPTNTGGSNGGEIQGCGSAGTSTCSWGSPFAAGTTQYMNSLPTDPVNSEPHIYRYLQTDGGDGYEIWVRLENASDQDVAQSQLKCDTNVTSLSDPDIVERKYMVCAD